MIYFVLQRGFYRTICWMSAILLTGCSTPESSLLHIAEFPGSEHLLQEALTDNSASLNTGSVPVTWWNLFNDPLLTAIEQKATSGNLALQSAALRIDESHALLGITESSLMPQLSAVGGYSNSAISGNSPLAHLGAPSKGHNTWSYGLQTSWELDFWGHIRQLKQSAAANFLANYYNQQAIKVSVSAEIATRYLMLRSVQAQVQLVEEDLQFVTQSLKLTETRQANGVATRLDVAKVRSLLDMTQARLSPLYQQRKVLMNSMAFLLGEAPHQLDAILSHSDNFPDAPKMLPVGMPSQLVRRRPDILESEAHLRAAIADTAAAKADFYPRISLTGDLGVQAFTLSTLGSWDSRTFSIGPTFYLPIFDGARLTRTLALTEARQKIAGIHYRQTVLSAWHEVDDALSAWHNEQERYQQIKLFVNENQQVVQTTQRIYQEGAGSQLAVLDAMMSLQESRIALIESSTASSLIVVELYRALGGGWPQTFDTEAVLTDIK